MDNIDLRLLRVFEAIHREASLSKAADRLGLTQPAISQALARLRDHFGDTLFTRTQRGMEPTPLALSLTEKVERAIALLEATLSHQAVFDPAFVRRAFRVCMTDVGQIVLLPRLLEHLRREAPGIEIDVENISSQTGAMLEAGDIELAVGYMPQIQDHFYQQALFDEQFVCLARGDHPRIRDQFDLADFLREEHVLVRSSGTGHRIVDQELNRQGIQRKVAVRIPNFLGLQTIIGSTDLVCTLPRRAGLLMAARGDVIAWPPPIQLPAYTVRQHWHQRQHHDPGCAWLRDVLRLVFGATEARARPA